MTFHTKGIVLQVRSSGEADRRVSLYTDKHGKLELFVKSARMLKSKLSPHLEPLTLVDCYIVRGRLDHLAGIERADRFLHLRNSLKLLGQAAWAAEIIDRLTKTDLPDKRIFNLLLDWFKGLERSPATEQRQLAFVVSLYNFLGFGPKIKEWPPADSGARLRGLIAEYIDNPLASERFLMDMAKTL